MKNLLQTLISSCLVLGLFTTANAEPTSSAVKFPTDIVTFSSSGTYEGSDTEVTATFLGLTPGRSKCARTVAAPR
jgi:hypothetical protein